MNRTESNDSLKLSTPSDREIVMTRSFAAPRGAVFDAFTKPELVRRWLLGPDGWSMPTCEIDLTPGGRIRYVWRSDDGSHEFGLTGTYREIAPPDRIVHAERFDDPSMSTSDAIVTTTFIERDGTTTVTLAVAYETKAIRDMALESGMASGVSASFDRLASML